MCFPLSFFHNSKLRFCIEELPNCIPDKLSINWPSIRSSAVHRISSALYANWQNPIFSKSAFSPDSIIDSFVEEISQNPSKVAIFETKV